MATKTKGLVGMTPGGAITEDHIAGEYFWYSISDEMVSLARVKRAFDEAGLDTDKLPKARRAEHVAQEACRLVEGTSNNGHRVEIRAEQVLRNKDELVYQITKHVQDKDNRVIDHPKALRVIFDMKAESLSFEPIDRTSRGEVRSLEDRIREHYERNSTKIPGHKLRTILRHYVEGVGAENMRKSGGIYFLLSQVKQSDGSVLDGRDFLTRITAMLTAVYGTPDIHRVPCVNDEGQRAWIKRKFIENCADDLEDYRDRLLDLVRDKDKRTRGFRQDMIHNLIEQRKAIDTRRERFAEVLQDELGELNTNMELADKALTKFLNEADAA